MKIKSAIVMRSMAKHPDVRAVVGNSRGITPWISALSVLAGLGFDIQHIQDSLPSFLGEYHYLGYCVTAGSSLSAVFPFFPS